VAQPVLYRDRTCTTKKAAGQNCLSVPAVIACQVKSCSSRGMASTAARRGRDQHGSGSREARPPSGRRANGRVTNCLTEGPPGFVADCVGSGTHETGERTSLSTSGEGGALCKTLLP